MRREPKPRAWCRTETVGWRWRRQLCAPAALRAKGPLPAHARVCVRGFLWDGSCRTDTARAVSGHVPASVWARLSGPGFIPTYVSGVAWASAEQTQTSQLTPSALFGNRGEKRALSLHWVQRVPGVRSQGQVMWVIPAPSPPPSQDLTQLHCSRCSSARRQSTARGASGAH